VHLNGKFLGDRGYISASPVIRFLYWSRSEWKEVESEVLPQALIGGTAEGGAASRPKK
jgi:hypothetical protein